MDEAARLKEAFKDVELPEIAGVDFGTLSHADIAKLLPGVGGKHPMKGILIDRKTGKAYGIASGWVAEIVAHDGLAFKSGAVSAAVAAQAGGAWQDLGNHLEAVAAAVMRSRGIADAVLYINGRNPCWGTPDGTGCYYRLPGFLAGGTTLIVYNKHGEDFVRSRPDRKFHFTGAPDQ